MLTGLALQCPTHRLPTHRLHRQKLNAAGLDLHTQRYSTRLHSRFANMSFLVVYVQLFFSLQGPNDSVATRLNRLK